MPSRSIPFLTALETIDLLAYAVSARCVCVSLHYLAQRERESRAETRGGNTNASTRGRLLSWFRWISHDSPEQGTSTFLKSAGVILLLLDLLVCAIRLLDLSIKLLHLHGVVGARRAHQYVAGLATETAWLQALWILHTHFIIQACVGRQQAQVTGSLRRPAYLILLAWCLVGLGPIVLADVLGIEEWAVRGPLTAVTAVVGLSLMGYVLCGYHHTLKGMDERAERRSQSSSRSSQRSHMGMEGGTLVSANAKFNGNGNGHGIGIAAHAPPCLGFLARIHRANVIMPEEGIESESLSDGESSSSEVSSEPDEAHSRMVEHRLRVALYRVVEVYVGVFLCVIAGGIFGSFEASRNMVGQALLLLLDLPYALLGWIDGYLVGGRRWRRRGGKGTAAEAKG